jgi:hypothetical protein
MSNFRTVLCLTLAACGGRPSLLGDSGAGGSVDCEEGLAIFEKASGGDMDVTADLSSGSAGTPASWGTDEDGTLRFCGGEWVVSMDFGGSDVTILGDPAFDPAIIKGGGVSNQINLTTSGATVLIENLHFTEGYNCWGSVVRAVDAGDLYIEGVLIAEGCDYVYEPVSVDLTLQDVQIYGNDFPEELGGGMIGMTESLLTMNDSRIYDNPGHGVVALNSDVICNGDSSSEAGIQGHSKNGVWMMEDDLAEKSSYTTTSNGCDWADNGYDDVLMGEADGPGGHSGFGDDASFVCTSSTMLCE